MNSIEDIFEHDKALVFGVGGGSDIVGTLPTVRLLEHHGVEVVIGGLAWERITTDPHPGPRALTELTNVETISESVAIGGSETRTTDGITFAETVVAQELDREVAFLDVTNGVVGLRDGLETACGHLDIDLVIGVDAGGDILATLFGSRLLVG